MGPQHRLAGVQRLGRGLARELLGKTHAANSRRGTRSWPLKSTASPKDFYTRRGCCYFFPRNSGKKHTMGTTQGVFFVGTRMFRGSRGKNKGKTRSAWNRKF